MRILFHEITGFTYTEGATSCYQCTNCSNPFDYTGNSSCYQGYADTCMV